MAANLLCDAPAQGLVLRLINLDSCGVPVTGSSSAQVVMDGCTQVSRSPQYDTGDRKISRKANGTLCQNYKLPDQFTNDEVTIDFCVLEPRPALNDHRRPTTHRQRHPDRHRVRARHLGQRYADALVAGDVGTARPGIVRRRWHAAVLVLVLAAPADGKKGDYTLGPTRRCCRSSPTRTTGRRSGRPARLGWCDAIVTGDHQGKILTTVAPPASTCAILAYP